MMDDTYVRKDIFDEIMKRIEAQNAASEARHLEYCARQDAQIAEIRGEVRELSAKVDGNNARLDDMNAKLDRMIASSALRWTIFGLCVTLGSVAIAIIQSWPFIKSLLGG